MRPARIKTPTTWHPTQKANSDSRPAKTISMASRTWAGVVCPTATRMTAVVVTTAPMVCAKRLGGPGKLATAPSPEAVYAACSRSCRRRWRCCAPADQGEDHPDDATAANAVSAKLDTDTLAGLVTKVQNDKQDPETVAKSWLSQNSLG